MQCYPIFFFLRFSSILISHQAVPLTFYNKIAFILEDTPTDEHSRANVLRAASDCLWPHRILVVSRSVFVLRIERVLYFLRQCLEPPVRFNFRWGRMT